MQISIDVNVDVSQKLPKMSDTKFNSLSVKFAKRKSNKNQTVYYINRLAFKCCQCYNAINKYYYDYYYYYYHHFVNTALKSMDFLCCGITFDPRLYMLFRTLEYGEGLGCPNT